MIHLHITLPICVRYVAFALLSVWLRLLPTCAAQTSLDHAHIEPPFKFNVQLGLDVWQINTPDKSQTPLKGVDRLYLANSYTEWDYHSASTWLKSSGQWNMNPDLTLNYKARADQSAGVQVNDLNFDYRLSPKLGFRAGVVNYKTSWCRTYETDSPWIQEIDPFCTIKVTNESTLAAPGLQAYTTFTPGNYLIQALVGIYRPKAFGYNVREFSNVANTKGVAINDRWGWSINAIDLNNASEIRLSWLAARQENNRDAGGYRGQAGGALYLGVSFYPIDRLNVRAYSFNSLVRQNSYDEPPSYIQILDNEMVRKSKSLELIYQINGQNTVGMAASQYTNDWNLVGMNGYESLTNPNYYRFTQRGKSVTWRHDWSRGVYTSIQITASENEQRLGTIMTSAKGNALGLRLGYAY